MAVHLQRLDFAERHPIEKFLLRCVKIDSDFGGCREDHHQLDPHHIGHERRCQILIDNRRNTVSDALGAPHHRNPAAAAGDNDRSAPGDPLDQRYVAVVFGLGRRNHMIVGAQTDPALIKGNIEAALE